MKKLLVKIATFNVGKCIASTLSGIFEIKVSDELQEEIK